ncbi:hypothetical protein [Carnimonas bestiolae]|uniref:hypothetical protein n=1 Tax=Carnimonas bestiolae TaxID=3402172 RepID=UPI003EDC017F
MTVWPYQGHDNHGGGVTYGEPYYIACTFIGGGDMQRDDKGEEFVPSWTVWHEDGHDIKPNDMILIGKQSTSLDPIAEGAKQVRKQIVYDMAPFAQTTDYATLTG